MTDDPLDQRWCTECGDRQHHDQLCRRCLLRREGWQSLIGKHGNTWFLPGVTGHLEFETAWQHQQRKDARGLE